MTVAEADFTLTNTESVPRKVPRADGYPGLGVLPHLRRDPFNFFIETAYERGDVVELDLVFSRGLLITHPAYIKRVLLDNRLNYPKSKYLDILKPLVGQGVFMSEGETWQAHRQIAVKGFQGNRLKRMVGDMADAATDLVDRWRIRCERNEPVDIVRETMRLTLDVFLRTMFGRRLDDEHEQLYDAMSVFLRDVERRFWALADVPEWVPTPANLARRRAITVLNDYVDRVIDERRTGTGRRDDLLQMLIDAYDDGDGEGKAPHSVLRHEVLTFIIAGQDTTASALAWTWCLLSKYPDIARCLTEEVEHVLQGREPTYDEIGQLTYTKMVFQEAIRLYPPAWTFSRTAVDDDAIGDVQVKKGTTVIIPPCAVHRRPDLWPNPEGFDPERFDPDKPVERDRFAYIPFGGGPRSCLGARFATIEAITVLATVAREFRLELLPGEKLEPEPMLIQRPRGGPRLRVIDA